MRTSTTILRGLATLVSLVVSISLSASSLTGPAHAEAGNARPDPVLMGMSETLPTPSKGRETLKQDTRPQDQHPDPLVEAWERSKISVDDYVRYSIGRLAQPDSVPEKFWPDGHRVLPHEAGLQIAQALALTDKAAQETRTWVQNVMKGPDLSEPRSKTEMAPAGWPECGGDYSRWTNKFSCVHSITTSTRLSVYYNVDGVSPDDGVQAIDSSPANGVPDAIDRKSVV